MLAPRPAQPTQNLSVSRRAILPVVITKVIEEETSTYSPLINNTVDPLIQKTEPKIQSYLDDKIGVNGVHFWQSKELKAFRRKMEEFALQKAIADEKSILAEHTKATGKAPDKQTAQKEYMELMEIQVKNKEDKVQITENLQILRMNNTQARVAG